MDQEKIKGSSPFIIVINIKYLGVTLSKKVKDKNFKFLKKESEEDIRKFKNLPHSSIGEFKKVKMAVLPKQYIDSMQSPLKFQKILLRPLKNNTLYLSPCTDSAHINTSSNSYYV